MDAYLLTDYCDLDNDGPTYVHAVICAATPREAAELAGGELKEEADEVDEEGGWYAIIYPKDLFTTNPSGAIEKEIYGDCLLFKNGPLTISRDPKREGDVLMYLLKKELICKK